MRVIAVTTLGALLMLPAVSEAATAVATYEFQNNFNPLEAGAPVLGPVDPAGASTFTTAVVLGATRPVYHFAGSASPAAQQAGFTLNTSGLLTSAATYSVDMVFALESNVNAWRRVLDVQNRQSDAGFYVDPSNNLAVYPVSGSTAGWTNNVYHHVVLTVDGSAVNAYLDGISQFSTTTALMDLNYDTTSNPNGLLGFFLDNTAGGGQGEWSGGSISLARLWDGALTPSEAQALANNPFIPEPGMLGLAAAGMMMLRRRAR